MMPNGPNQDPYGRNLGHQPYPNQGIPPPNYPPPMNNPYQQRPPPSHPGPMPQSYPNSNQPIQGGPQQYPQGQYRPMPHPPPPVPSMPGQYQYQQPQAQPFPPQQPISPTHPSYQPVAQGIPPPGASFPNQDASRMVQGQQPASNRINPSMIPSPVTVNEADQSKFNESSFVTSTLGSQSPPLPSTMARYIDDGNFAVFCLPEFIPF